MARQNSDVMFSSQDWLLCRLGGEFLLNHIKRPEDGRCYFQVTADGQPIKIQRTLFTECFYVLAMAELARASNLSKYRVRNFNSEQKCFCCCCCCCCGFALLRFVCFFVFLAGDLAYVNWRETPGIENDRKDKFFHNSHPGNNVLVQSCIYKSYRATSF